MPVSYAVPRPTGNENDGAWSRGGQELLRGVRPFIWFIWFPRSAWEPTSGRSASRHRVSLTLRALRSRDAERPDAVPTQSVGTREHLSIGTVSWPIFCSRHFFGQLLDRRRCDGL